MVNKYLDIPILQRSLLISTSCRHDAFEFFVNEIIRDDINKKNNCINKCIQSLLYYIKSRS